VVGLNVTNMIWKLTGNKWRDKWIKNFYEFSTELDSDVCKFSKKDIESIKACMDTLKQIMSK
jgi:hypothetical protein